VSADPEPKERVILKQCESAIATSDANGPQFTDLLETQGRMARIGAP